MFNITFYFLLNLLWIVQVSIELCSSQWKPHRSENDRTDKQTFWKKALGYTLEIKLGPLFQGL